MFLMLNLTDILAVIFLIILEGLLSLDNALVLALTVRVLPLEQQKKALTYGIWGAIGFRFLAMFALTMMMHWWWVKVAGGVYLLYMSATGLFGDPQSETPRKIKQYKFWAIVALVELLDIAFSVDSMLTAASLTQTYAVIMAGGVLGIVMMRFAAQIFIGLVEKFPRLEQTAYTLVGIIGLKLLAEAAGADCHKASAPGSWIFWIVMIWATVRGFRSKDPKCVGSPA